MMINGISLDQALEELKKPDGMVLMKLDNQKYEYVKIDYFKVRLNQVIGSSHHYEEYSDFTYSSLPTGQLLGSMKCTMYFVDDEGKVVYKAEGFGTGECSMKELKYINLNNFSDYVTANAFKACCFNFGMFARHTDVEETSQQSKKEREVRTEDARNYLVQTLGAMKNEGNQANGQPTYSLKARIENNDALIFFYPNMYKNYGNELNNLIIGLKDGKSHTVNLVLSKNKVQKTNEYITYTFKGIER